MLMACDPSPIPSMLNFRLSRISSTFGSSIHNEPQTQVGSYISLLPLVWKISSFLVRTCMVRFFINKFATNKVGKILLRRQIFDRSCSGAVEIPFLISSNDNSSFKIKLFIAHTTISSRHLTWHISYIATTAFLLHVWYRVIYRSPAANIVHRI